MQHNYNGARIANALLGLWLLISAFIWSHSVAQMTNTWILGVAMGLVAVIGLSVRQIRFVNTVLAAWLFVSAFVLPTMSVGTAWNNAIVAVVAFVLSLVGSYGGHQIATGTPGPAAHV